MEERSSVGLFAQLSSFFGVRPGEVSAAPEPIEQEVAAVPIPSQPRTHCSTCSKTSPCSCSSCNTCQSASSSSGRGSSGQKLGTDREVDLETISTKISRQFTYPQRSRNGFDRGLSLDSRDAEYQFYIRNSVPKGYTVTRPPRLKVTEQIRTDVSAIYDKINIS